MNPVRLLGAGVLAVATTFGLIFTMHALIEANLGAPEEEEQIKIADVVMPEQKIETQYDTSKPDKPDEPETPPPDMPEPEFDDPNMDNALNMSAPRASADLKMGGIGGFASEGDYLPIVKVAPQYPRRALQRGIEGYAIVEYTVTKNGSVRDAKVIEAFTADGNPTTIFNRAAVKSALKYKYKPRVVDGEPIEVPGVRTKISFNMASN
ncbi:energy transducer TonB [Microbulbifer yueqingensis]|uniref:Outer membrane transport energization protein TonB n=1 Tax=Microbulbifer yueqingensis TaxID=658219 RepID=A0A1G8YD38_9GAMM|nr:energy transducer TonB [Microbulbifer yueqingensis]SDK00641.1 outer membrane transport energization protein TonB [Microbulbifer yueqingensis]